MTFSSSRKLHQHFANQATIYSAHAYTTPPASSTKVSLDQHSFLQSMIKGQSHGQLPATQTSIASGNATIAQHLLPHVVHPSDVSMSISQTGSTPPGSVSSRGNGANNVRLRRRLSDKDKERRLVRRSSSKRKDKENGGDGTPVVPATSSGSLDKFGSSGALTTGVESGESGPPSIG